MPGCWVARILPDPPLPVIRRMGTFKTANTMNRVAVRSPFLPTKHPEVYHLKCRIAHSSQPRDARHPVGEPGLSRSVSRRRYFFAVEARRPANTHRSTRLAPM